MAEVQRTLPPGWEAIKADRNSRIYYWNKKTGATTWDFPEQEGKVASLYKASAGSACSYILCMAIEVEYHFHRKLVQCNNVFGNGMSFVMI